jgi:hypothetical protein
VRDTPYVTGDSRDNTTRHDTNYARVTSSSSSYARVALAGWRRTRRRRRRIMTRDETASLLRARSALTSQPYGDDVVDAWHEALGQWSYFETRAALIRAARDEQRVSVAHLVDKLPKRSRDTSPPTLPFDGPTDGGRTIIAETRRRLTQRARPGHVDDCECLACSLRRHPAP